MPWIAWNRIYFNVSERKKLLCRTLRYLAHLNGASLLFVSSKDDNGMSKAKQLLSHFAFKGSNFKTMVMDHNKPLSILCGQDQFAQIGTPPSETSKDVVGKQSIIPFHRWKADYESYFPKDVDIALSEVVDLSKYPEPAIDTLREKKDEELEKLRAANLRRLKDREALNVSARKKDKSYSRAKASKMAPA